LGRSTNKNGNNKITTDAYLIESSVKGSAPVKPNFATVNPPHHSARKSHGIIFINVEIKGR